MAPQVSWVGPLARKFFYLILNSVTEITASVSYTASFFMTIYCFMVANDILMTEVLTFILYLQRLAICGICCLRLFIALLELIVFANDEIFGADVSKDVPQPAAATPTSARPTPPQLSSSPPPAPLAEPAESRPTSVHEVRSLNNDDNTTQVVKVTGILLDNVITHSRRNQSSGGFLQANLDQTQQGQALASRPIIPRVPELPVAPPDPSVIHPDMLGNSLQTLAVLKLSDSRTSTGPEAIFCDNSDPKVVRFDVGGDVFTRRFDCVVRPASNNNARASDVLRPWMAQYHQGRNLCLMLDGASGTGKSWAFCDGPDSILETGFRSLFDAGVIEISFTAVEIYLNAPKDLLVGRGCASACYGVFPASEKYTSWVLKTRDLASFKTTICKTLDKNRTKSSTENNVNSSRGHTICVLRNARDKSSPVFVLCDLAGAENLEDLKIHGADGKVRSRALVDAQAQESQQINIDRTALETWALLASENKICPGDTKTVKIMQSVRNMGARFLYCLTADVNADKTRQLIRSKHLAKQMVPRMRKIQPNNPVNGGRLKMTRQIEPMMTPPDSRRQSTQSTGIDDYMSERGWTSSSND